MKVGQLPKRHKASLDQNMIPLINIVFLMLIFFMVAGQIMQSEPVKVKLPSSVSEQLQPEKAVVIVVDKDGLLAFDKEVITKQALVGLIAKKFNQSTDKKSFNLQVNIDGDLPVENLREILGLIRQTGVKRVSLATQQLVK